MIQGWGSISALERRSIQKQYLLDAAVRETLNFDKPINRIMVVGTICDKVSPNERSPLIEGNQSIPGKGKGGGGHSMHSSLCGRASNYMQGQKSSRLLGERLRILEMRVAGVKSSKNSGTINMEAP